MAKAKKLPSGSWRVQASAVVNGKLEKRSFTAPTAREAELAATEWQVHRREIGASPANMTVFQAIEEYIAIKRGVLSPSTIKAYGSLLHHAYESIREIPLKKLDAVTVQRWISAFATDHTEKTVRNAYGLLTAAYNTFTDYREQWRVTLPQKKKPNGDALSRSEIAVLLNGIQGHSLETSILLAIWLGLRRSEVAALTWDDIDFENNTLSVTKAKVETDGPEKYVIKPPKTTDSTRTLRIPPYIRIKLLERKEQDLPPVVEDPGVLSRATPKLCTKLGLPPYGFHDLRRTMATVGSTLNIADKLVMARGGWNNIQTMKKIYQIVLSDAETEADQQFNDFFEALL